jgi:hypothetical protein
MISMSVLASPGGSAPSSATAASGRVDDAPSSSAKQVVGRRNTSVWILAGSTSLNSPWFCQNSEVSVASGSMMTRNFSLDSAALTLALLGRRRAG